MCFNDILFFSNLCPNWAMDVSRYDTIRYQDTTQFEYVLNENIPLGPTSERGFETYSAYSEGSRSYASIAADYPVAGVDSFWVHTINDYANATTPVYTNVLLAHPDASPDHPGNTALSRVLYGPKDALYAVFKDGGIHEVNLETNQYTKVGSITDHLSFAATVTYAQVIDGDILKSFVMDKDQNAYLIRANLAASPVTVQEPLKINYIKGKEFYNTPINALMTSSNDAMPETLTVVLTGNFDQIDWVNEETGDLTEVVGNMMEATSPSLIACYESTKDCDYWRTSSYDRKNHLIYIQAHTVDADGTQTESMMKLGWTQSKIDGEWYAYVNTAMWPMNFGYSGYQYVTIKQD
jgi:hypothetical protein